MLAVGRRRCRARSTSPWSTVPAAGRRRGRGGVRRARRPRGRPHHLRARPTCRGCPDGSGSWPTATAMRLVGPNTVGVVGPGDGRPAGHDVHRRAGAGRRHRAGRPVRRHRDRHRQRLAAAGAGAVGHGGHRRRAGRRRPRRAGLVRRGPGHGAGRPLRRVRAGPARPGPHRGAPGRPGCRCSRSTAGSSSAGRRAAASHTARAATPAGAARGGLRLGGHPVGGRPHRAWPPRSACSAASRCPRRPSVAVLTNVGGGGVLAADALRRRRPGRGPAARPTCRSGCGRCCRRWRASATPSTPARR